MNKISKLISVLLVMLLLVFTFYGSGREMKTQTETSAGVSWLNRSNNLTIWYTDERLSAYISKAAVECGEREDVTVIPVLKPADSFIEGCYAASVEGESYPDVIITGSETLEKAYYSGMACEITDEDMQIGPLNFSDAAVNAVTYKGMKLGYPLSFDTCVLVYNRTYLEQWASQMAIADLTGNVIDMEGGSSETEDTGETGLTVDDIDPAELEALTSEYIQKMVPYTLEDLLTIANSYSVPDGVEGILSWDMSSIMYNYWLVGGAFTVGGEFGDDRHNISINNSTAAECLKKYQNLHDYFSIESDEVTYDSVIQQFIDGKTVFTIGGYDLVRFWLETGRTHQIRVHSAYLGHPVAGDTVYGGEKNSCGLQGQCLHAMTLGFTHPSTGERLTFTAPLPTYFTSFLKKIKTQAGLTG